MNPILEWLSGGDLRSDGMADEVAELVLKNPAMFNEIIEGLEAKDDVIRARTADALEKIARIRPDLLIEHLPKLLRVAESDAVPMVKMHLAMIMGHLAIFEQHTDPLTECLLNLLEDESVFTRSWAVVSLCILARKYPQLQSRIIDNIVPLSQDDSIAIRTRVRKALALLTSDGISFPKGWIKSEHLKDL
jgi:HEAT repeat protein